MKNTLQIFDCSFNKRSRAHEKTEEMPAELENIFSGEVSQGRYTGNDDGVIASTVLDHACAGGNMELIAADSKHLIILKYFWNSLMGEITITPEVTKKFKAI